jgi:proteasome lid subunit RPN8/RPN11
MQWNEQPPEVQALNLAHVVSAMAPIDVIELLRLQRIGPVVVMEPSCRARVHEHVSSGRTELGGLLIGWAVQDSRDRLHHPIVGIHQCIPSRSFKSSSVSLAMNADLWDDARHHVGPKQGMVVGWYHSHPNLGAFFSSTDRRTQRAFFCQPYSLGLVIDPVRGEEAWFLGSDSLPIRRLECIVSGSIIRSQPREPHSMSPESDARSHAGG